MFAYFGAVKPGENPIKIHAAPAASVCTPAVTDTSPATTASSGEMTAVNKVPTNKQVVGLMKPPMHPKSTVRKDLCATQSFAAAMTPKTDSELSADHSSATPFSKSDNISSGPSPTPTVQDDEHSRLVSHARSPATGAISSPDEEAPADSVLDAQDDAEITQDVSCDKDVEPSTTSGQKRKQASKGKGKSSGPEGEKAPKKPRAPRGSKKAATAAATIAAASLTPAECDAEGELVASEDCAVKESTEDAPCGSATLEEATAESNPVTTSLPTVTSKPAKAPSKPRAKKAKDVSPSGVSESDPAIDAESLQAAAEAEQQLFNSLPAEIQTKVLRNKERIAALIKEVCLTEGYAELTDTNIGMKESIDKLVTFVTSAGVSAQQVAVAATPAVTASSSEAPLVPIEDGQMAVETADPVVADATTGIAAETTEHVIEVVEPPVEAVPVDPVAYVVHTLRCVIASCIEGSPETLSQLVQSVALKLETARETIDDLEFPPVDDADEEASTQRDLCMELRRSVVETISRIIEPAALGEEIKDLATREAHGIRAKAAMQLLDSSTETIWRWQCNHLATLFSRGSGDVIKCARANRKKYGIAAKAFSKCNELLMKLPLDQAKLDKAEEEATGKFATIEKNKAARVEAEAKRITKQEEKTRQDAEKEAKRKEKEEEKLRKKEEAAAKKLEPTEAELKRKAEADRKKVEAEAKKAREEKSKSLLFGFLGKPVAASVKSADPATASSPSSSEAPGQVIDLTEDTKVAAAVLPAKRRMPMPSSPSRTAITSSFESEAFLAALSSNMSMADIMASNREKALKCMEEYKLNPPTRRMAQKSIMVAKLSASAPAQGAAAFGQEAYTEMQEVLIDDKIRVFSFHEDQRPAYVGSFSKHSSFVTGRRPFGQDFKQLNYDYDSEEEWEEADEGEDIMDSEGEEEEGDNELEYNDFFRRDNDYGSDVDSDGEGVAAAIVQRREGEERIGPRFLRKFHTPVSGTAVGDDTPVSLCYCSESRSLISCLEKEKDVQRLRSYPAVTYSYSSMTSVPTLGVNDAKRGKGSKDDKAEADEADAPAAQGVEKVPKEKKPPKEPKPVFDESCVPDLIAFVHGKKDGIDRLVAQFHEERPHLLKVSCSVVRFCYVP